ncbi:MAG: MXAN_6577-like cysteine-rich protein [Polyangiales bacterium]
MNLLSTMLQRSSLRAILGGLALCSALAGAGCDNRDDRFVGEDATVPLDSGNLTCNAPEVPCRGACLDPTSDPANCGACGIACPSGSVCVVGQCRPACPTGQTRCGDRCVDSQTDNAHCGACGAACAPGLVCSQGRCGPSCGPMYALCSESPVAVTDGGVALDAGSSAPVNVCADTRTNERHCGACGNRCPVGQRCEDGACALRCVAGPTSCGDRSVDTQTDPANCGACGTACTAAQRCVSGSCSDTGCPAGTTQCGSRCVDTAYDSANCGMCGNVCASPQYCRASACVIDCPFGRSMCSGACVDTANDQANCGTCGTACAAGQVCEGGMCRLVCPMGTTDCMGRCVDVTTDRLNCGMCGRACPDGQLCAGGGCSPSCPTGAVICSGRCTDPQNDNTNCGGCGINCGAGYACREARCVPLVGTDATGCVAPSLTCGGVCVDPRTDNRHCGMCGRACADDAVCAAGNCLAPCAAGLNRCGAACVDTRFDAANCGSCGNTCSAGLSCINGACTAEPTLHMTAFTASNCRVVDHNSATGDDRGGVVVSGDRLFVTGDTATARLNASDLMAQGTTPARLLSPFQDVATGQVYVLLNAAGAQIDGASTVTQIAPVDGVTGAVSMTRIALSAPITVAYGTGIFSGPGRLVLHNGTRWYQVRLPTGQVTELAMASAPTHRSCESWGWWGVAEYFGGELYATYVQSTTVIARYRVRDAMVTPVSMFTNVGDMCSITVSLTARRWYFHHEYNSQFGGDSLGETAGYCDATFE